jgi:DNA-binding FrmR family transcriptional regulator
MPKGSPRDISLKHRLLHRLQISQGHLGKVISSVREDEYCMDIIHQSQAVRAGLKKFEEQLMHNHLSTCVVDQVRAGQTDQVVSEVMKIMKRNE